MREYRLINKTLELFINYEMIMKLSGNHPTFTDFINFAKDTMDLYDVLPSILKLINLGIILPCNVKNNQYRDFDLVTNISHYDSDFENDILYLTQFKYNDSKIPKAMLMIKNGFSLFSRISLEDLNKLFKFDFNSYSDLIITFSAEGLKFGIVSINQTFSADPEFNINLCVITPEGKRWSKDYLKIKIS